MIKVEEQLPLEEMARAGYTASNYEVVIYTEDDGYIPHFHFRNREKGFDTCICIEKAEYFIHGKHQNKLNTSLKDELSHFMKDRADVDFLEGVEITNWQYVASLWNKNNSKVKVSLQSTIPDYTQLK